MGSPISGNGDEGEDAATHGDDGDEGADLAVDVAEGPVAVQHVDEVEGHVQGRDHRVGDAQVHWKKKQFIK